MARGFEGGAAQSKRHKAARVTAWMVGGFSGWTAGMKDQRYIEDKGGRLEGDRVASYNYWRRITLVNILFQL